MVTAIQEIEGGLRRAAGWSIAVAIGMIVLGIFTLVMPLAGALTATIVFGSAAFIAGALEFAYAWRTRKDEGSFWRFVAALAFLAVGLFIFMRPDVGMVTLAMALGVALIIRGAMLCLGAYALRQTHTWGWFLLDGVVGLLLGVLIVQSQALSIVYLGVYVGVTLIANGVQRLMVASTVRRHLPKGPPFSPLHA